MKNPAAIPEYQLAQREAVYFLYPESGLLSVSGPDRVDFIQRQTTNDVRKAQAGAALTSVMTSATARILDVLTLIVQDDRLLALTLPGQAADTAAFLKSKIFFMDNVEVNDHSADYFRLDIEGPTAAKALAQLGIDSPPAIDGHCIVELDGVPMHLIGIRGLTSETGYHLVGPRPQQDAVLRQLLAANCPALSATSREILRIEAGRPGPTTELTQNYTPLETGLAWTLSHTKGCYTGQEVIARQVNYDKITKQIVRLTLSALPQPGDKLRAAGKNAGTITSVAHSPQRGPLALAILKRPHFENGTQLTIENDENTIEATVETII